MPVTTRSQSKRGRKATNENEKESRLSAQDGQNASSAMGKIASGAGKLVKGALQGAKIVGKAGLELMGLSSSNAGGGRRSARKGRSKSRKSRSKSRGRKK